MRFIKSKGFELYIFKIGFVINIMPAESNSQHHNNITIKYNQPPGPLEKNTTQYLFPEFGSIIITNISSALVDF